MFEDFFYFKNMVGVVQMALFMVFLVLLGFYRMGYLLFKREQPKEISETTAIEYTEQGKIQEAIQVYRILIEQSPSRETYYQSQIISLENLKKHSKKLH